MSCERRKHGPYRHCDPILAASPVSRRRFVAGAVALGAFAASAAADAPRARARNRPHRPSSTQRGPAAAFNGDDRKAIERENALRIVPRLRTS